MTEPMTLTKKRTQCAALLLESLCTVNHSSRVPQLLRTLIFSGIALCSGWFEPAGAQETAEDAALQEVARACRENSYALLFSLLDAKASALRCDPRFEKLRKRLFRTAAA